MQAHPQSTPAARIPTTPLPASRPAIFAAPPTAQPRVRHLIHPPTPSVAQTAGLAHDAGNLLGALTLYCDLLRAPGVLGPAHRHYATELSLIASRSSALIQRLLSSAPAPHTLPNAGSLLQPAALQPTALQPADVRRRNLLPVEPDRPGLTFAAVLRTLAPVLERIAAGAATVSVIAPVSLLPVDLFPKTLTADALERITVNLVRNAAEAIRSQRSGTPADRAGEIRITLALVAGRLQLSVEDNGPGMPPGVAAAFLQPAPLPAGTRRGLGHRIVHELVTASGGRLSIRVRPGQGSAFCIKWPLPGSPLHDAETASFASVSSPLSSTSNRTLAQKGASAC